KQHPSSRDGGGKAVSVSNQNQDRHGRLLLAAAGAAVRRSAGIDGVGEDSPGGGAARSTPQSSKGSQAREEGGQKDQDAGGEEIGCEEEMVRAEEGAKKEVLIQRSALFARVSKDGR